MAGVAALILIWAAASSAAAGEDGAGIPFDDREVVRAEYPDWFEASFMDLRDDLASAREDGKTGLMLFFDAAGCAYCKAFVERTLGDPGIRDKVRAQFRVIGLDMFSEDAIVDFSGRREPVKDFALRAGATVSPTLLFCGSDGTRLLRLMGYHPPERFVIALDYLAGGHFETESLGDYAVRRTAPVPSPAAGAWTDPLFMEAPFAFDRSRLPAQRPLLILFDGGDCPECLELRNEVLSHPPVREQLGRYDAARLDRADTDTPVLTPAGEKTSPAAWAERLGIVQVPTLVFFDEGGEEVFRLDPLVLRQRMERAFLYVLAKAYVSGKTYQQFTREKTIERLEAERSPSSGG